MKSEFKVPVRALVEYVFSSGSIDAGFRSTTSLTEGTKIHAKIQKNYQEFDRKEVLLQTVIQLDGIDIHIHGRADGILFANDDVTIDEIKSTSGSWVLIKEDRYPVHWAQAQCYAYMYAKDLGRKEMMVQLTYSQVQSGEMKRFKRTYSFEELEAFMFDVVNAFLPYVTQFLNHQEKRNNSIDRLTFPFKKYRKGQRKLAGAVYKTILEKKTLFVSAPTGIGKTISTIFPAIKAIGEGMIKKVFYLTAKTITRQAAEDAFRLLAEQGLHFQVVTITAKDKVCFKEETVCTKEHCEYAEGYYDRVNGAVLDILEEQTAINRSTIESYAQKHRVCPFEFSLDLAYLADGVICDYNYVFDPRVNLKRFTDEHKKQSALLVDEAHNLVDRAREMYSVSLNKAPFLQLRREYKARNKDVFEQAKQLNDYFISIRKQAGTENVFLLKEFPIELNDLAENFITAAEQVLLNTKGDNQLLLEMYFSAQSWLRIAKLYDNRFVTYCEVSKKDVLIKQFCLDPSVLVHKAGKAYRGRTYFSATLTPLDYFMDMLGGSADDFTISLTSSFAEEQTDVFIFPLSTRYNDRTRSVSPIVRTLEDLVDKRPGNYIVFFPSYQYLNLVVDQWQETGINTVIQGTQMQEGDREAFLAKFAPENTETLVGFAVLGGIFSEGIDLKGDRLNGVIVVGVGLPQLGYERDLIKNYFASIGKNGYDYAYVFPGMNKVLQAGGRLIRSEEDQGTIVLIDDRFLHRKYQQMLPYEWSDFQILNKM